jgi:hypothetical protein
VAQKLHSQYGYPYNNLQVLLGGWNSWKEKSAQDPAGYPMVVNAAPGGTDPNASGAPAVTTTIVINPQPVGTQVP